MKRNAAVLLICRLSADLLNLLFFVLISRAFGPHGTGIYAFGFAIAGLVYVATTAGIDDYGIREYARASAVRRGSLLSELLGFQALVAGTVVAALVGYLLLTPASLTGLVAIVTLALFQLASAFAGTLFIPTIAEERMLSPALTMLLTRTIAFASGALVVWNDGALGTALLGFPVAGAVLLWASARSAHRHGHALQFTVSTRSARALAGELWSFAGGDVLGHVVARTSVVALTLQVSESAAGIYATGMKFVDAACLAVLFLSAAAYPRLCVAQDNAANLRRLSFHLLLASAAIVGISALALFWLTPLFLVPVFGAEYAGTETLIAAMSILALVQGLEMVLGRVLLASNLQFTRMMLLAIGAITCIVLNAVTIPMWGVPAAIAATALCYLALCATYLIAFLSATRQRAPVPAMTST